MDAAAGNVAGGHASASPGLRHGLAPGDLLSADSRGNSLRPLGQRPFAAPPHQNPFPALQGIRHLAEPFCRPSQHGSPQRGSGARRRRGDGRTPQPTGNSRRKPGTTARRHQQGDRPPRERYRRGQAPCPPAFLHLRQRRHGPTRGRRFDAGRPARGRLSRSGRRGRLTPNAQTSRPEHDGRRRPRRSGPARESLPTPHGANRFAQPPQDRRDRRPGGLHGLAKHRRRQLRPQRPRLERPHGTSDRTGRLATSSGLPRRLVLRNRHNPRRRRRLSRPPNHRRRTGANLAQRTQLPHGKLPTG